MILKEKKIKEETQLCKVIHHEGEVIQGGEGMLVQSWNVQGKKKCEDGTKLVSKARVKNQWVQCDSRPGFMG